MKTADEMMIYLKENGFKMHVYSSYEIKKRALMVEELISESEEVLTCFVARKILDNESIFPNFIYDPITFAYRNVCFVALTNKRIIEVKIDNLIITERKTITIELTYLNDITKKRKWFTKIIIDTIKEQLSYIMFNGYGGNTYSNFQKELLKIREKDKEDEEKKDVVITDKSKNENEDIKNQDSTFEEMSKNDPKLAMNQIKELLEEGLISQKQYDEKMEEILKRL